MRSVKYGHDDIRFYGLSLLEHDYKLKLCS